MALGEGAAGAPVLTDLRAWISCLENAGELCRIRVPVDWEVEIGAIVSSVLARKGPALLFENIKGYEQGRARKVFVHMIAKPAQSAMLFGQPKDAPLKALVEFVRHSMQERLEPVVLESGPVKENIFRGVDINLYDFPIPQWNEYDGGRYMNTMCGVVTRDPDTGWINVGLYRGMIGDRNRIPVLMIASQHWGRHFAKYRAMKKPMPVAVFYGGDPVLALLACSQVPSGVSEYAVAGAIRGAPVELVTCETSDLFVPARAEIVVEGFIDPDPDTYLMEGPFKEYTGHYSGKASPKPVIQVECITHRDDPVYQGSLGFMGNQLITRPAHAWNLLEASGVPGVTDVWCDEVTAGTSVIVQIHKTYLGQAKQVAMALWGSSGSTHSFKNVTVVDEDIDIRDHDQMQWAMAYRLNAGENDMLVYPGTHGSPLDPSTRMEERDIARYGSGKWNRVLFDATKNWELPRRPEWGGDVYPPTKAFSEYYEELVKRRWAEYGL